jgi:hypothetical protein
MAQPLQSELPKVRISVNRATGRGNVVAARDQTRALDQAVANRILERYVDIVRRTGANRPGGCFSSISAVLLMLL